VRHNGANLVRDAGKEAAMKIFHSKEAAAVADPSSARLGRRGLVVGSGVASAAALAAVALHRPTAATPAVAAVKPVREAGDGYRETQHVLRYYETTRA
jgi:hypothetical protein